MPDHTYRCLPVEQQKGAPLFYMTAVPASELLLWADVPRARGEYMAGYQRVLNESRSNSLTAYLKLSPANIVPGAIIVAVDADYVAIKEDGPLTTFTVREDKRTEKEKLLELFGAFSTRLSAGELASAGIQFTDPEWDESTPQSGDKPESYLATLAQELNKAIQDWESIPSQRQIAILEFVKGVSKPGLIIDGQHRVWGAAEAKGIVLPVILLPGLEHAEQVFQFYVLNSKAVPLRPTELRRIVSTSLANSEIDKLYDRFKQAGVSASESRWSLEMNTRPDSPFKKRIDFGLKVAGEVIKENVADQLVRGFMLMPKKYNQLTTSIGASWTDPESRLNIFFWFWNAVKSEYAKAWAAAYRAAGKGKQHQLFTKVALLTLQKFILDRFLTALPYRAAGAPPPFSSEAEVKGMVASTLENLPEKFFVTGWKAKQIDTSEGRDDLYKAMEKVWNDKGKGIGKAFPFKK